MILHVNGSDIDGVELSEYWRMSNGFKVRRYDRMLWASERYAKRYNVPNIRVYKALDRMLSENR